MLRALLFDMGGTLDADGLHWLDRFAALYADAGVSVDRDTIGAAFDRAEQRAAADDMMMSAHLEAMIGCHVRWQLEYLTSAPTFVEWAARIGAGVVSELPRRIGTAFLENMRRAAARNVPLVAELAARGYLLGVVSNGCGNVHLLCEDLGYAPFLSLVVDSRRARLQKPDPAIFLHAAARLALPPSTIMMIGDSFERDVQPARSVGMMTAWLQGARGGPCPDASSVDIALRSLTELPAALDAFVESVA